MAAEEEWFQLLPQWFREDLDKIEIPPVEIDRQVREWQVVAGQLIGEWSRPLGDDPISNSIRSELEEQYGFWPDLFNVQVLDGDGFWAVIEGLIHTTVPGMIKIYERYLPELTDILSVAKQIYPSDDFTREVYINIDLYSIELDRIEVENVLVVHHSPSIAVDPDILIPTIVGIAASLALAIISITLFPPATASVGATLMKVLSPFAAPAAKAIAKLLLNADKYYQLSGTGRAAYSAVRAKCPKKNSRCSRSLMHDEIKNVAVYDRSRRNVLLSLSNWEHGSGYIKPVGKGGELSWKRRRKLIPGSPNTLEQMLAYLPFLFSSSGDLVLEPVAIRDEEVKDFLNSVFNSFVQELKALEDVGLVASRNSDYSIAKYLY